MKLEHLFAGHKSKSIVFVPGYRKGNHWDVSEHGRRLDILQILFASANIFVVHLDDEDYKLPIPIVTSSILEQLPTNLELSLVVAHSYGCFFAMDMVSQSPSRVKAVMLLDPVVKDESYRASLAVRTTEEDPNVAHKLKHWDDIPDASVFSSNSKFNKVVFRVHLILCSDLSRKLEHFLPTCKANVKSGVEIHASDHMIHYSLPHMVIDRARNLLKSHK